MAASIAITETVMEPPYCNLKIFVDGLLKEKLLGVKLFLSDIQSGEQFHKMLLAESRLLHISIYKRSAQLRREKSIQLLKRVKACLQRLHNVNRIFSLSNDLNKDISSSINTEENEAFLPSQQVWTYLLHLASNYYSVLNKTVEYSVTAFEHLSSHFATGMLIPTMVLFMGIMARTWQVCRSLQVRLAKMYATMYAFHWEMKPTISDWAYPSLPTELFNPVPKTISQAGDWFGAKLDLADMEQDSPQKGTSEDLPTMNISIPSVRSTSDDLEDLGVTVFSKKRKGWRTTDDSVFPLKKRKTQQNTTLLQERPQNKTFSPCPASEISPGHPSLKKRKKKKKSAGQVNMTQNSEQVLDTSHNQVGEFKMSKKEKLLKKKRKKLATAHFEFETVSGKKFSNDKKSPKCKRKSVPPSKMEKKQANSDKKSEKKEVQKVTKEEHKKIKATNYVMTDKEKKKKKKKEKVQITVTDFIPGPKKLKQRNKKLKTKNSSSQNFTKMRKM